MNDVLDFTYSFLQRLCTERLEKSPSPLEEARLNAMLMRIRITHTQFQGFLKSVMKNLDSAQMKMQVIKDYYCRFNEIFSTVYYFN